MLPYIKGDTILVPDRKTASTLINKGCYGKPLSGGVTELSLIEAAYLVESKRLEVKRSKSGKKLDHHELLVRGMASGRRFLENYLVFRDIRNRGMNIQGDGDRTFMVYPRGQGPKNGKADNWIMVFREHDSVDIEELFTEARRREGMRMGLLAAVVDGDFDVTYYSISTSMGPGPLPLGNMKIEFTSEEAAEVPGGGLLSFKGPIMKVGSDEGLGTDLNGTLAYSNEESAYLTGVVRNEDVDDLKDVVYRDLRSRGALVRTGFKYGTHFRVYTSGSIEDHSDLLVHCTDHGKLHTWEGLARAIRLSHSVRKRMVYAFSRTKGEPAYLELNWTRP